jgi:protein arginine kinase
VDLKLLLNSCGEWLRGTGEESDIVISSRVRLARNLADTPFPPRASEKVRRDVLETLRTEIPKHSPVAFEECLELSELSALDRQFLMERQLISRELAESRGHRGVFVSADESVSLMINEEDHLRIQVLHSGYALNDCWEQANRIDDELQAGVAFAFDEELGYLTSCPTNVGTGIRVSVMLHLPALVMCDEMKKVFASTHKMGLAVRGLYGEGSQALGDYFQVSNQATLGLTEEHLVNRVQQVVPDILSYERRVRAQLLKEKKSFLHDKVSRAYGLLGFAQQMSTEDALQLLSKVRLGRDLGLLQQPDKLALNQMFLHTQPAHLQKLQGKELDKEERDQARAAYLRERLHLN